MYFKMLSAIRFILDQSKILSFGNGLNYSVWATLSQKGAKWISMMQLTMQLITWVQINKIDFV